MLLLCQLTTSQRQTGSVSQPLRQRDCFCPSNCWDIKHDLGLHQGQKSIHILSQGSCIAACWSLTALQTAYNGLPVTSDAGIQLAGVSCNTVHSTRALKQESIIQITAPFQAAKLPFFIETERLTWTYIFSYLCLPEGKDSLPVNPRRSKILHRTPSTWSHLWAFQKIWVNLKTSSCVKAALTSWTLAFLLPYIKY